jgi:hypothetical protein
MDIIVDLDAEVDALDADADAEREDLDRLRDLDLGVERLRDAEG